MKDEYSIKNEEEMVELGQEFAKQLKPSDVVLLYGELGSGKTTFTKGRYPKNVRGRLLRDLTAAGIIS